MLGLKFAHELEVDALMVESDAIKLVSAINDNLEPAVESPVLKDVQVLLDTLQRPLVSHIRRNANQMVHLLAPFGFNSKSTRVWSH